MACRDCINWSVADKERASEVKAWCLIYISISPDTFSERRVWEVLAVGGYFMPVSLNEFWWAAVVQTSLTVPTSLCSFPVFRVWSPTAHGRKALSAVLSESLSVWSTSNIFEQFRQGWVQVIQSLPEECFGEMRRCTGSQGVGFFISVLLCALKLPINMDDIFKWTSNAADIFHLQKPFEVILPPPKPSLPSLCFPFLRQ